MSMVDDWFNALMFGSGAWFGAIIILSMAVLVSYKARYSSAFFIVILIMLEFNYLQQIGNLIDITNNFVWAFVINGIGLMVVASIFLKDVGMIGKKK